MIKGPVLSARCYGDPGLRQYGDLDLIVRDKDIQRSTELMISLGYEPAVPLTAIQAKKIPGEYVFRQSSTKLLVEFHTELTFRYHPRPLPVEKLFKRQARVNIDVAQIPALSPEDELILICIHGAKHFWEQLSYIADVAAFVSRQELDWARVSRPQRKLAGSACCIWACAWRQICFSAPLPESVGALVRSDRTVGRLAGRLCNGFPRRVPRRREFSSERCFECACAAEFFLARRICFGFLFRPPRKIGWKALKTSGTGFWMRWDGRFVSRAKYGNDGKP